MNEITYCKSWFRAKKCATKILEENQAREAHEKKQEYAVLVGDPDRPRCFIEINNDFVGVCFLDELLRENLTYQFQEVESGKLFLSMATYRDFEGEKDKVLAGTSYIFGQDGKTQIRKETFSPHSLEVSDTKGDVSGNYESYPKFGDYSQVAIAERS
ncbi:MAG: lytic transglycosylase [Candidatus Brocadiaceae bacterium]|nr:lytic transglycosylase [Candidatus Brocadiaceae bacterium]